jgi:hypothetical protein
VLRGLVTSDGIGLLDDLLDLTLERDPVVRILGIHAEKTHVAPSAEVALLQPALLRVDQDVRAVVPDPYGGELGKPVGVDRRERGRHGLLEKRAMNLGKLRDRRNLRALANLEGFRAARHVDVGGPDGHR